MHRIWKIDPGVTLRAFSVTDPVPELTDELRAVIPAAEIVEVLVRQFERGLQYVQGRFERILEPGRYLFWNHPGARTSVQVLDTRVQQLKIHHMISRSYSRRQGGTVPTFTREPNFALNLW